MGGATIINWQDSGQSPVTGDGVTEQSGGVPLDEEPPPDPPPAFAGKISNIIGMGIGI